MNTIILGVFGPAQVLLVLVIVLFFFGGKKIPQLMKGIGQGIREFKQAKDGGLAPEKTKVENR